MTDDNFESFLQRAARDYNAPPSTPRDAMWARIEAERRSRSASVASHGARARRWLMLGAAIAAMLLVGIGIGYVLRGTMDSRLVAERPDAAPDSARQQIAGTGSETASAHDSGSIPGNRNDAVSNDGATPRERSPFAPEEQRIAVVPPGSHAAPRNTPESMSQPAPRSSGSAAGNNRESAAYAALTAEHLGRVEVLLTSYRAESERGQVDPQITSWAGDLLGTTRLLLDSPGSSDPQLRKLLGDLEMVLTQITQLGAEQGSKKDELQLIDQSLRSHDVMTRIRGATPAGAGALPIGT
jgi:hypothetical protein